MLGKIFKSERTDNNNRQPPPYPSNQPVQQQPVNLVSSTTSPNKKYQVQILQQVNESPPDTPQDDDVQTPGFTDTFQYGDLGLHMSKFEQKSSRMAEFFNNYNEESEPQSEADSNRLNIEEQNPMILSDSNANFRNTDRLSIMRIRNYVSDLKQVHMDLSEYVHDQKSFIEYFRQKICLETEEFFRKYSNTGGHQNQQFIKSMNHLKGTVQQQNLQIQRLHRELNESKEELECEQQKNRIRSNNLYSIQQNGYSTLSSQKYLGLCPNCKQLQAKISVQQSQIEQRQAYIQSLVAENQSVQQKIFDLEQKIVGIDLEVEKRLKERSKNTSERELRARLQIMQSTNDDDRIRQIEQLNEEILSLQQKCKRYERADNKQNELLEKIRSIEEKELHLHYREVALKETEAQLEEQKYVYSNKQRNILMAEDALAKKKEELRNKEAELSQWQAELAQKEREVRYNQDHTFSHQFEDDELNKSKEMSLKSFGANKDYHGYKIQGETFNNTNPVSLKQSLQIPHSYNSKNQEIHHRNPRVEGKSRDKNRTQERQPYSNFVNRDDRIREGPAFERQRTAAVHPAQRVTGIVMNKKMDLVPNHYRQLREESSFGNLREQNRLTKAGGRVAHQFDLPSSHYRESSKNSRGTSKGVRQRQHLLSRSGVSIRESTQLSGIGSKLQRLRAEIKKQIDSIK